MLVDGRHFRQSKTSKLVVIKETPEIATRLADARQRVSELTLRHGLRGDQRPETIVIDETTGRGYVRDTFRDVFSETREAVIAGIVDEEGDRGCGRAGHQRSRTDAPIDKLIAWKKREGDRGLIHPSMHSCDTVRHATRFGVAQPLCVRICFRTEPLRRLGGRGTPSWFHGASSSAFLARRSASKKASSQISWARSLSPQHC